jgi:hypothetical protein
MAKPLLTEAEAERFMFSLYDIDFLDWSAQEIHKRIRMRPYDEDHGVHLETEGNALLKNAVPSLLILRLGVLVEQCVGVLCSRLFDRDACKDLGVKERLTEISKLRTINVVGLKSVWLLRSRVAHNPKKVVTWDDVTKHTKVVWDFVEPFAKETAPDMFQPMPPTIAEA